MTAEPAQRERQIALASRALADAARALGFQHVAVAPAAEVDQHRLYQAWLAADQAGDMTYLGRDAATRRDPRLLFARAKSVVCVALPYLQPEPAPELLPGERRPASEILRGQIARYARAADYHLTLKQRLMELGTRLAAQPELFPELAFRACVDTAPVLERALGARAGLGFQGKNTLLITPGVGSYTVLGELLLDAELPSGEPAQPRCGTCTLCLDVCPTGALRGEYQLDARLCISYLTIENTGPIPRALRPLVGDWVFGCDLCQQVCPWNAAARLGDPAFRPSPKEGYRAIDYARPDLVWMLGLGAAQFRRFVKRTALRRLARAQLLRNVAVALGNLGRVAELAPLCAAFVSSANPPLVRQHVAWALGRIGEREPAARSEVQAALVRFLATESDEAVREELRHALASCERAREAPEARIGPG